jgi:hypothetical protein
MMNLVCTCKLAAHSSILKKVQGEYRCEGFWYHTYYVPYNNNSGYWKNTQYLFTQNNSIEPVFIRGKPTGNNLANSKVMNIQTLMFNTGRASSQRLGPIYRHKSARALSARKEMYFRPKSMLSKKQKPPTAHWLQYRAGLLQSGYYQSSWIWKYVHWARESVADRTHNL